MNTAQALGIAPPMSAPKQLLTQIGGPAPEVSIDMPALGPMPGKLFLNPKIAPKVPENVPRPFAPGEYIRNPDGGWSSEVTVTVTDPRLNDGNPTIIPSLWIENGQAVRVDEDQAVGYALGSGLSFPSFGSIDEAEKFSIDRETSWQQIDAADPSVASAISPLWSLIAGAP